MRTLCASRCINREELKIITFLESIKCSWKNMNEAGNRCFLALNEMMQGVILLRIVVDTLRKSWITRCTLGYLR